MSDNELIKLEQEVPVQERLTPDELISLIRLEAAAKMAVAQKDLTEARFLNMVLAVRSKYKMSEVDNIDENGVIKRV